jgi:hypothetical protein
MCFIPDPVVSIAQLDILVKQLYKIVNPRFCSIVLVMF